MEKKVGLRQYLSVFLLFGVSMLFLGFTVDVSITDEAGVRTELPDALGEAWSGHEILFCHNQHCGRDWLVRDLELHVSGVYVCPEDYSGNPCGGKLHTMALGEYHALPRDTVLFKKRYFHNDDPDQTVFASVVLSGNDRSSIHRPEVCMTGQGHRIERTEVIDVELPGREPLQVMVMDLSRTLPNHPTFYTYYAYWFVGKDIETPHHLERLIWMGFDRVFRNVAHRWAYIAVAGAREMDGNSHHDQIRDVVSELYPAISLIGHRDEE